MSSRQTFSGATRLFFGPVAYAGAYEGKRGAPLTPTLHVDFGAVEIADADGVSVSQSVVVATTPLATITGALASGGVATFTTPRNVVAAWTGTAVVTITGTDQYGRTVKESSASGTSLAGKKAFKTVTSVSFSANVTAATVGTGDVLGLPVRVAANGLIAARANNAIDAGTFVPGVTTDPATATTGDVRGTYDPAVTIDGTNTVAVHVVIADPNTVTGVYGVTQYSG
jgi:hypothetical protein